METNTAEAVPEQSVNGMPNPDPDAPRNKTQLIVRIIEAEMAQDGKVDNQRVLTLARFQGPQFEPTMRDVQQMASRIRRERGLHDKVLSERMRQYGRGRDNPAKKTKDYRTANAAKAREAKAAKLRWSKEKAGQGVAPVPASFNQMQLLSARSFLAACGNDAATAAACLETVKSLTL